MKKKYRIYKRLIIATFFAVVCSPNVFGQKKSESLLAFKYKDSKITEAPTLINIQKTTSPFNGSVYYTDSQNKPLDGTFHIIERNTKYSVMNLRKGVQDGAWRSYTNNTLAAKGNYKNGKLDGEIYFNGGTKQIMTYKDGIIQRLVEYYSNDKLYREINYNNGKINGLLRTYSDNGELIEEAQFLNGEKNGEYIQYYRSGSKKIETYKNGQLCGKYLETYPNGSILSEGMYDDSSHKTGLWIKYDEEGRINEKSNYLNNKLNGIQQIYDKGKLLFYSEYKDGIRAGKYEEYWPDTDILKIEKYDTKEGNIEYTTTVYYNEKGKLDTRLIDYDNGKQQENIYNMTTGKIFAEIVYLDGNAVRFKKYDNEGNISAILLADEKGILTTVQEYTNTGKITKRNTSFKKSPKIKLVEDASGIIDIE